MAKKKVRAAKKSTAKKSTPKTAANAAGEVSVNKSKAVRDFYAEHPNAMPRDVVAGLAKKGILVTPQYVSVVRTNSKKKVGAITRPAGRPPGTSRSGDTVSVDALLKIKKVVEEIGGLEQAKAALDALTKLAN